MARYAARGPQRPVAKHRVRHNKAAHLLDMAEHVVQDWSVADFTNVWFNSLDTSFSGTKVRLPCYPDYHVGVQFQNTHKAWYNGQRVVAKFSHFPGGTTGESCECWVALRSQANDNYVFGWGGNETGNADFYYLYPYYNDGAGLQYPVTGIDIVTDVPAYLSFRTDPADGKWVWEYCVGPGFSAWTEITRMSPPPGFWTPEIDVQFGAGYFGASTPGLRYAEVEWFNGVDSATTQTILGGSNTLTITLGGGALLPGVATLTGGGVPVTLNLGGGQVLPGVATISGGGVALTITVGGGSLASVISLLGGGVPLSITVGGGTLTPLAAPLSGGGVPVTLGVGGGDLIAQGTPLSGGGIPVTISLGGGVLVPGVATLSGAGIPVLISVGGGTVTPAAAGGTGGTQRLLTGVGR